MVAGRNQIFSSLLELFFFIMQKRQNIRPFLGRRVIVEPFSVLFVASNCSFVASVSELQTGKRLSTESKAKVVIFS